MCYKNFAHWYQISRNDCWSNYILKCADEWKILENVFYTLLLLNTICALWKIYIVICSYIHILHWCRTWLWLSDEFERHFTQQRFHYFHLFISIPDSKVHGANMGPTWVLSVPDGPHVGPMNLAIRDCFPLLPYPLVAQQLMWLMFNACNRCCTE